MLPLSPLAQDQKTLAERRWRSVSRPSAPQLPCDHGLFSDEALQLDLIEMLQEPDYD
jgi:hypothetical protein